MGAEHAQVHDMQEELAPAACAPVHRRWAGVAVRATLCRGRRHAPARRIHGCCEDRARVAASSPQRTAVHGMGARRTCPSLRLRIVRVSRSSQRQERGVACCARSPRDALGRPREMGSRHNVDNSDNVAFEGGRGRGGRGRGRGEPNGCGCAPPCVRLRLCDY